MVLRKSRIAALLLAFVAASAAGAEVADRELRLWPGTAPGSESWSHPESVTRSPSGDRVVRNVVVPTLTVFLPERASSARTAVVIAPGGALRVLGIDNEGEKVARWLNARGIAAFVLKYRTLQSADADPMAGAMMTPRPAQPAPQEVVIRKANANPDPGNAALGEVLRFAIDDARAAMRVVRRNAEGWQIDPKRVGMMGFSAGGGVAIGLAMTPPLEDVPDFLISLYGPSLMDVDVRADAPPLFVAVGARHFNVASGCIALFDAWRKAGRPAELHVYDQVSGGFGMTPRGLPVDAWTDRLLEWLVAHKLVESGR